jgi:hypothetical protein
MNQQSVLSPRLVHSIQPVPRTFTYDGYEHVLIERSGRRAIFSKARPQGPIRCYEVVRLGYRGAEIIKGKHYPARETYPRSEDWGVTGWTCMTLGDARKKMGEIEE